MFTCSHSRAGRVRAAFGAVHLVVWRPVSISARPGVPGSHGVLRAMAWLRLWPLSLRAVDGRRDNRCRCASLGARYVHQRPRHRRVLPVKADPDGPKVQRLRLGFVDKSTCNCVNK